VCISETTNKRNKKNDVAAGQLSEIRKDIVSSALYHKTLARKNEFSISVLSFSAIKLKTLTF
jgi:hypothetical protein